MIWLASILALVAGLVIGFLVAALRGRNAVVALETSRAQAQQKAMMLESLQKDADTDRDALQTQLSAAREHVAAAEARLAASENNLREQRKLIDQAQEKLGQVFAEASDKSLQTNIQQFLTLAEQRFKTLSTDAEGNLETKKKEVETLLAPMQQVLTQYRAELEKLERTRESSYRELIKQISGVEATQRDLHLQTRQLVDALRRPQTRGRWGELTLRRLFEMAGMSNRCSFTEQVTTETTEGNRQRPDVIVELPEGRQLIIDSKVVIDAFLDATSAADEQSRSQCLTRHAKQVRSRLNELSAKAYWSQFEKSPDYVVMFLPGESFLHAAIEVDPNLIEDALNSHVLIASPTTLLGLLRVIEAGWKQRAVEENANTIRDLATDLYDRIRVMAEHFMRLGKSLDNATDNYNATLASLERNVITQARRMADLGVKSKQPVPTLEILEQKSRELSKTWAQLGDSSKTSAIE